MREHSKKRSISSLAALLLLGVFAVSILSVLLTGASAYRRLMERDRLMYDNRTCLQYVATKIRQAPNPEAVTRIEFGDGDGLVISEQIGETEYWTRIYCYDGWLMELFTIADGGFMPEDGEKILQIQQLSLSLEGSLLQIEIVDSNGTKAAMMLTLRGGEGAAA